MCFLLPVFIGSKLERYEKWQRFLQCDACVVVCPVKRLFNLKSNQSCVRVYTEWICAESLFKFFYESAEYGEIILLLVPN
jgi:ferredoxin